MSDGDAVSDLDDMTTCPNCGETCWRDEVDVGVGVMYGPWGCPCGWSEDERFNLLGGPKREGDYVVDQWGGLTPRGGHP